MSVATAFDAVRALAPLARSGDVKIVALVNLYFTMHNRRKEGFALSNDEIVAMEAVDKAIQEAGV